MLRHRNGCVRVCLLILSTGILAGCASSSVSDPTIQITPAFALVSTGQKFQFTAVTTVSNPSGFPWEVNGVVGGSPSTGTITSGGVYTAPNTPISQAIQIGVREQSAQATVSIFDPTHPPDGSVTTTQNPLVASYTLTIPAAASAQVQFGTDTSYGLSTSAVPSTTGGSVTILVAGMRASTPYHMQAVTTLADGTQLKDTDHTFQTGAVPAAIAPNITTQLTGNGTPSPGIELLSLIPNGAPPNKLDVVATDLAGNVVWYYPLPTGAYPEPVKLLPNGHMLLVTNGTTDDVREIDLAGNIINDLTLSTVNQSLAHIASYQILQFTHDILRLPNNHYILLANIAQVVNDVPGIANGTAVAGNAVIDWDIKAGAAVWAWSTFDHLSLSHAPYGLFDWTHGNALYYSPDDGNILLSLRNQNWVLKLNYQDGEGDGSVLWRLGPGGDFTLPNGLAPIEWNYGQHYVTIQSPNSSGVFSLMFFNNGNSRVVDANNDVCGTPGFIACYSSVPIFQLNEYTKTASVLWENKLSPAYSICCGDALILPNGNVEYDVALDVNTPNVSYIEEVTQTETPELIWRMNVQGQLAYRGFRIPSLYPDQVWPAYAQQNVRRADPQH